MATSHADLLKNILAFDFDDGDVALSFARRLARENGWSLTYAKRAIVEYKRFAYLACTAGHPVTPSDQVDQVWHLHLTYTRSYWDRFCGQVLGRPLHHDPTRGGDAEAVKFESQYDKTLASYAAAFGEPAPCDIWPASDERFGEEADGVRVVRGKYWMVRKPSRLAASLGLVVGAAITWLWSPSSGSSASTPMTASMGIGMIVIVVVMIAGLWIIARLVRRGRGGDCSGGGCGGDGGSGGFFGFGCGSNSGGDGGSSGCSSSGCGGGGCGGGGCGS